MFHLTLRGLALSFLSLSLLNCESTDRMVAATQKAMTGRTGRDVVALIGGKDPSKIAKERLDDYARDPERVLRDLRAAQHQFQALYDRSPGTSVKSGARKRSSCPRRRSM